MAFTVTTVSAGAVRPSSPTPAMTLPLAYFDQHPVFRNTLVETIHIYDGAVAGGNSPATVIRAALAKALVFYYPMAGRIVDVDNTCGIAVQCTGDGVFFVDAEADCSLEDVRYLEQPMMLEWAALLAPFPDDERWTVERRNTILMMQVTRFRCGGFVVGLRWHHAVMDGAGAAMAVSAIADIARGLVEPKIMPVWNRGAFPNPDIEYFVPGEDAPLHSEYIELDLPSSYINAVKSSYAAERGKLCSSFDVVAAKLWQCQTRASADLPPKATVTFRTMINIRRLSNLGDGYYGNACIPGSVSAPCEKIRQSSLLDVIDMIREVKEGATAKWSEFVRGKTADPMLVGAGREILTVVDWSRLGFTEVNFGFGPPKFWTAPVPSFPYSAVFILNAPAPLAGKRLLSWCVGAESRKEFVKAMTYAL